MLDTTTTPSQQPYVNYQYPKTQCMMWTLCSSSQRAKLKTNHGHCSWTKCRTLLGLNAVPCQVILIRQMKLGKPVMSCVPEEIQFGSYVFAHFNTIWTLGAWGDAVLVYCFVPDMMRYWRTVDCIFWFSQLFFEQGSLRFCSNCAYLDRTVSKSQKKWKYAENILEIYFWARLNVWAIA